MERMGGQTSGVSTQELFAPIEFSCRFVLFALLVPFVSLAVTGADKLSTDWGTDGTDENFVRPPIKRPGD